MKRAIVTWGCALGLVILVGKIYITAVPSPWPMYENSDDLTFGCFLTALYAIIAAIGPLQSSRWYMCSMILCLYCCVCLVDSIAMYARELSDWSARTDLARENDVACYSKLQAIKQRTPNTDTLRDACRGSTNYYSDASYILPGSESLNDTGLIWIIFEGIYVSGIGITLIGLTYCTFNALKLHDRLVTAQNNKEKLVDNILRMVTEQVPHLEHMGKQLNKANTDLKNLRDQARE